MKRTLHELHDYELSRKFRSKKDFYDFLTIDCKIKSFLINLYLE